MFCRNCANTLADQAVACPKCGVAPWTGNRHCWSCAEPTAQGAVMCVKCGVSLVNTQAGTLRKSRLAAGLMNLLLPLIGVSGIGRIYMGYVGLGVAQLVVGLITCGIGGLWSLIDGIVILSGKPETDAKGQPLE